MSKSGRKRSRSDPGSRRAPKGKGKGKRKDKGLSRKTSLMMAGVILLIILLVISAVMYNYIIGQIPEAEPELEVIDVIGSRSDTGVDKVETVKISFRNSGTGTIDVRSLTLYWEGPGVDTTLYFNTQDHTKAGKDAFAVGGVGRATDGWDPDSGKFKLRKGTIAWVVVNLTSAGGIGDLMDPGFSFMFTLEIEDGGTTQVHKVPNDLGTARFFNMPEME